MDQDSPVEYTGDAHLVSRSCTCCDDTFEMSETEADHQYEHDIPPICHDCYESITNLWDDMYIRDQIQRARRMADYLDACGYTIKATGLRSFTNKMDAWESVIHAVNECDSIHDREAFESMIQRYDEA